MKKFINFIKFIKFFILIIFLWNIIIYLIHFNEEKIIINSKSKTLIDDNEINQKYCGINKECKFLFAYHVPEQETSANFHFYSFIQLAELLNRTIILVNVQHSRLSSCNKFPFNFYYNVNEIKKMFPNVNFITQQNFLNWTKERYNKPITIHKYIKQEGNPLILNTNHLELKKECLDQFDLKFNNNDDLIINNKTTINLGPKDVWRTYSNNILMIDNLIKLLNVKEEVLLIRHLLPVPLFPSKGSVKKLPYANHLIEGTNHASDQF
ncbi:unnamed protein product [Rhizophagus irregularis]|uniref:Uncharacterized protein n=1 Tax=Rhizophagus irregularis TaxID=588596 RepID=A0A2I1GA87_9GLOM|nr:hypothetical protein RhiirA4_457477 [Rhizophagus irregularis]CAB4411153.1 unnamed protein product [Rhizophagus irregularis]